MYARTGLFLLACNMLTMCVVESSSAAFVTKKVHEAMAALPKFPKIDVSAPGRFLNDLRVARYQKERQIHREVEPLVTSQRAEA